ncbi:MAG: FAD-dependent oxidoreductase [Gammaproteobacteria bacterium]|nr:FAD-dependent oxidoreductase [Gammaproteobacteria bacterium]
MAVTIQNWKRDLSYSAHSLVRADSVNHIVSIVKDTERYPSPVRVKGSHHSTTRCIEANGGTVIDVSGMDRILEIDTDAQTICMQAGVRHIDAARALEKKGLQFYVNVEIGNLTVGSGACGGTKDASFISDRITEYGQVASYCIAMKVVQADGSIVAISEQDSEMMSMMRSSYGLLGILVEVTYRVKPLRAMAVRHQAYSVHAFVERLDELLAGQQSMMLYLFPFLDRVVVEYRYDSSKPVRSGSWQWRLRNYVWKTLSPGFARVVGQAIPWAGLRHRIYNGWNRLTMKVMQLLLRDCNSSPADQIIRYPETAGFASYTFSIWAFPRASYGQALLDYFEFCRNYHRANGYRCDLLNVGYSIAADRQSQFSYSRRGPVLTLDPVATGADGWPEFLDAYNEFCHQHQGTPLFNQTPGITPAQVQAAFAAEIPEFLRVRERLDPEQRFYTPWFRQLLEQN